ncbi:MAG: FAD-dependent oxidoreductase [bacterium]
MGDESRIAIIGGGVAGMTAALDLADHHPVALIERESYLGGRAAEYCCKATDSCAKCGACLIPSKIVEVWQHPGISIFTGARITALRRQNGSFHLTFRAFDAKACGEAFAPSHIIRESRNAGATNVEEMELDVQAVVLATGFEPFDPRRKPELGYGRWPNIITALDLERRIRETGSFYEGERPKRVAFVQCVGSRDRKVGNPYCSRVCCIYAMRLARWIKYESPDTEVTIFYIDIQTAGKGFDEFYRKCQSEIRFVRGKPSGIYGLPGSRTIRIKYESTFEDKRGAEDFDLVVLSIGIAPRRDDLASLLGLSLNDEGFLASRGSDITGSTSEGIFLAGTCQGPKSIPDSIAHAKAAAANVLAFLARVEGDAR